jgi:hypothetical protein
MPTFRLHDIAAGMAAMSFIMTCGGTQDRWREARVLSAFEKNSRAWSIGRALGFQPSDGSSILPVRTILLRADALRRTFAAVSAKQDALRSLSEKGQIRMHAAFV